MRRVTIMYTTHLFVCDDPNALQVPSTRNTRSGFARRAERPSRSIAVVQPSIHEGQGGAAVHVQPWLPHLPQVLRLKRLSGLGVREGHGRVVATVVSVLHHSVLNNLRSPVHLPIEWRSDRTLGHLHFKMKHLRLVQVRGMNASNALRTATAQGGGDVVSVLLRQLQPVGELHATGPAISELVEKGYVQAGVVGSHFFAIITLGHAS